MAVVILASFFMLPACDRGNSIVGTWVNGYGTMSFYKDGSCRLDGRWPNNICLHNEAEAYQAARNGTLILYTAGGDAFSPSVNYERNGNRLDIKRGDEVISFTRR